MAWPKRKGRGRVEADSNRLGQTEILGLVIVVLLITLGIMFMFSAAYKKAAQPGPRKEFVEKQLVSNMLGAMLSTSVVCEPGRHERMSALLIACGSGEFVSCAPITVYLDGEQRTISGGDATGYSICNYLNETIDYILDATLARWAKNYAFSAFVERPIPLINTSHNFEACWAGYQTEQFFLPLKVGALTVELRLCS